MVGFVRARGQSPKCYLKELRDVLLNCPSRYVCSMLNCYKTFVSEKVANQRAFMINHPSSMKILDKVSLSSNDSLWPAK